MKPENRQLLKEGVEITYTTSEVAQIFRKRRQWVLWSLKEGRFLDKNEQPFTPEKGPHGGYIWRASEVKNAAISCYNRRTMDMTELKRIFRKVIKDTGEINERY